MRELVIKVRTEADIAQAKAQLQELEQQFDKLHGKMQQPITTQISAPTSQSSVNNGLIEGQLDPDGKWIVKGGKWVMNPNAASPSVNMGASPSAPAGGWAKPTVPPHVEAGDPNAIFNKW